MSWMTADRAIVLLQGFGVLVMGLLLASLASRIARRLSQRRFSPAQAEVGSRLAFWSIAAMAALSALRQVGFDLSIFVGAAGLLTVALGFASQTSASNLISGLFLLFERPFTLGDVLRIGPITGEVVSIDLLSVRLRTFDNLLVRMPNETLLKTEITNLSHFPIRRYDLVLPIHPRHDLDATREHVLRIARSDNRIMEEPLPIVHFTAFTDSGVQFQVSVWVLGEDYLGVKNDFPLAVHRRLAEVGIEIPLAQRVITQQTAP